MRINQTKKHNQKKSHPQWRHEITEERIRKALRKFPQRKQAAKSLGICTETLRKRIAYYQIDITKPEKIERLWETFIDAVVEIDPACFEVSISVVDGNDQFDDMAHKTISYHTYPDDGKVWGYRGETIMERETRKHPPYVENNNRIT